MNTNNNLQSLLCIISELPISSDATKILIKAIVSPDWIWHRKQIKDMLNIGEYKIRIVLNELKKIGVLFHKDERNDKGMITKKFIHIDVYKLLTINDCVHVVDQPHCGSPTHIDDIYNNIYTNTTGDTIYVDQPHCGSPTTWIDDENIQEIPAMVQINLDNIPRIMTGFKQWIYIKEIPNGDDKPKKIPHTNGSKFAKVNDPTTWHFFKDIQDWGKHGFLCPGFVLTGKDPFTIIDLDDCIVNGKTTDFARNVVLYFKSYTEVSPSGTGLHIIIRGKTDKAIKRPEIEIYYQRRTMAMTGCIYYKKPVEERQDELDRVIKKYHKVKPIKARNFKISDNGKFTMPKEAFSKGCRNNELARWAGVLRNKSITEQDYIGYLHQINRQCCIPPLPDDEVDSIANSIKRYT